MPWNPPSSADTVALLPPAVSRREVLVASGVALSGCSAVGAIGAAYERSDIELSLGLECTGSEALIASLSWTWDSGGGGSAPDDVALLYWDDRKWELQVPVDDTTEAVEFEARGAAGDLSGVRFAHDDTIAEGGTTYAASCQLEPIGDWSADERNVFAKFAHVRERANDASTATQAQRPLGDLDQAWDGGKETDQAAAPCPDGS